MSVIFLLSAALEALKDTSSNFPKNYSVIEMQLNALFPMTATIKQTALSSIALTICSMEG